MQLLSKSTLLASAIAALVAAPASAAVLTPGTDWTTFFFSGDGSTLEDADTGDTFWSVTLTKAGFLQVTDAFLIGDVFEMSVDGSSIGTTGPFDTTGPETSDPDVAFGGPVYSWLSYALAPGTYEITGIAASSPFGSGGAFLRVVPVPEAATWAMMIAGFGLVGAASRRARQAIA